jgi:nicotinamidase-related amidase
MRRGMGVEPLELRNSALIVWDMQQGIAGRAFNRADLVVRIKLLLTQFRIRRMPVVYSQHTSPPPGWSNPSMDRSMARRGITPGSFRLAPGAPEWEILPEVAPSPDELVLAKTTPSFFVGTPLEEMLRFRHVDVLVLTGVSTEAGILGTARHASTIGFHPLIVEDAVGSPTPEGHAAALGTLRALYDVEPTARVLERLPPP